MTTKLVRDLMHIGVATCQTDTPLVEAVRTLLREDLESLIVLDEHSHARHEVLAGTDPAALGQYYCPRTGAPLLGDGNQRLLRRAR